MKYYVRKVIVLESFDLFVAFRQFWMYIIINFFKTFSHFLMCVYVCVKILRLCLITIFVFYFQNFVLGIKIKTIFLYFLNKKHV